MNNVHHLGAKEAALGNPHLPMEAHFSDLVDQISHSMAELRRMWLAQADAKQAPPIADSTRHAMQVGGAMDLQVNVRAAKKLLDLRKKIFGGDLFSGPGWGILLQLFESYTLQRTETVGQVCIGADLPCSTVLRWLNKLNDEGLVKLRDDHLDGRRRFAELSDSGVQLMTQYFSGAAPHLIAA